MSCAFRSIALARTANLMGKDDFQIYMKNAEYNQYMFYSFSKVYYENVLKYIPAIATTSDLSFKSLSYERFSAVKDNLQDLFMDWVNIDFKTSSCVQDYALYLIKTMPMPYYDNVPREQLDNISSIYYPFIDKSSVDLFNKLKNLNDFKPYTTKLLMIIIFRFATRITCIVKNILNIQFNLEDSNSFWNWRDIPKNHVMTLIYKSTSYGRKDFGFEVLKKLRPIPDYPNNYKNACKEFLSFIDKTGSAHLGMLSDLNIIDDFLKACSQGKPVSFSNEDFKMTIYPKVEISKQVQCYTYHGKNQRSTQLTVKKLTNEFDIKKFNNMLLANVAHFLDSTIMHHYVKICCNINEILADNDFDFRIIFERNHDCFLNNVSFLLEIIVEEAILRFLEYDFIHNLDFLTNEEKSNLVKSSKEEFMKELINNFNPYFLK